jgi:hypothetical protein
MDSILADIKKLYDSIHSIEGDEMTKIPQSGGDRMYFRIVQGNQSWIATYSLNIKESETFIGDVRQVIKDLDTGRGGMNASNAIKQINNLFYDKHKINIKKIIDKDDDSSD